GELHELLPRQHDGGGADLRRGRGRRRGVGDRGDVSDPAGGRGARQAGGRRRRRLPLLDAAAASRAWLALSGYGRAMEVTVAALQTALTDDVAANVARVTELCREAVGRGAQIILPSELFEGHYFCRTQREDDFARARPAEGHPTIRHFQQLAAELGAVIAVSFFEAAGPEHYNSIATIDDDGRTLGV